MSALLVVAYYFPPLGGSGSLRTWNVVRALASRGVEVGVLTTSPWTQSRPDPRLAEGLAGVEVRATPAWDPYHLRRAAPTPAAAPGSAGGTRLASRLLGALLVPHPTIGWLWPALREGRRWTRERRFDAVLSTQPPITAHLVGRRLAREAGARLVVEYRDLWLDNHYAPPPSALHAHAYRRLERRILADAAGLVTVSEPHAQHLGAQQPGLPVTVVPNGFDPESVAAARPEALPQPSLVYLGTVVDGCEPALMRLMDALARHAARPHLFYVGNSSRSIEEALARHAASSGLGERYHAMGFRPHHEGLGYVRGATAAVVCSYPASPFALSGKTCEYLGCGAPILGVLEPGMVPLTERFVALSGGATASMHDAAGLARAVDHVLVAGAGARQVLPESSRPFQWPELGARYEEAIFGKR